MVVKTAASVGGLFHLCRYGRPARPVVASNLRGPIIPRPSARRPATPRGPGDLASYRGCLARADQPKKTVEDEDDNDSRNAARERDAERNLGVTVQLPSRFLRGRPLQGDKL